VNKNRQRDVIVIGGGPAGSTAAALIAGGGRDVLLLDRETFPRFRIGESLMPATYWTLERLGVLDKMKCSHFPNKHSVQFFSRTGKGSAPFYFSEVEPPDSARTWQVDRREFDAMLLENAAAKGAEVRQGVRVHDILFDGDRAVGVSAELEAGKKREIGARVVVDASGQSMLIARKLNLRRTDPNLKHCAFFTRYKGAVRDAGLDEGATLILHTEEEKSWFWYIPLPDDVVSVGVVGPLSYLVKGRPNDPAAVYAEELALCKPLLERVAAAEMLHEIKVLKDFTYACKQIAGNGWVLAGDAFGFIDPIYSSGVFLALRSGELAADVILEAFENDDFSAAQLGKHGPEFVGGMNSLRKLVYAFYDSGFSFGEFLRRHPDQKESLVHLLIGNVYRQPIDGLLRSMDEYHPLPEYEPIAIDEPPET
jgi:flavin-dependent dehydrogenase